MDTKELIFNMYKEEVVLCKKFKAEIKKKYNITGDDARDIFVRIQNYQIKNYGHKLEYEDLHVSPEDLKYKHQLSKMRKHHRRNRSWENVEAYRKTDSV